MKRIILVAALLLSSCNREEQPQAPTEAEAERLDEAEQMLDNLAKEEGAAPESTAPSSNN